ncbi:Rha family transcriptional regulator [Sphaerotilus sp.]|uniref:Rha family transcriptional regulator n=1 Tax=Sphaerotilus sp. TaxID=2093942 RepID=UPI00286DB909|nr:Rha family transcriptional regulator [Sphaerotilus sp.]
MQQSPSAALVTVARGQPMTDSRLVATEFGKSHKNVLRSIDAIQVDLSPEFWRLNFEPRDYADDRGKVQRMFTLTQAGFTALVMGFTGKKAVSLRERFIVAFQRVTAELARLKAQRAAPEWKPARLASKSDFLNVVEMLKECREAKGKITERHHYTNESKLMRFAFSGDTSTKWSRDNLSAEDLKLLAKIERLNMRMLARELSYSDRKAQCRALWLRETGFILEGGAA